MANTSKEEPLGQTVYVQQKGSKERPRFFDTNEETARSHRVQYTITIRILLILFQIIFNSFDFSTDAFRGVPLPAERQTWLDWLIRRGLRGFTKWDAAHMVHLAHYGYHIESSLAFFPLYPMFIRYVSLWAVPLTSIGLVHVSSIHILTGVLLNLISFYIASECLYDCVLAITYSEKQAHISAILFAINPASIFFTSAYTESVYFMFTLLGIRALVKRDGNFLGKSFSLLFFALSYLTRANGLLNFGYFGFYCLLDCLFVRANGNTKLFIIYKSYKTIITKLFILLIQICIGALCIIIPVSAYGTAQQGLFCNPKSLSRIPDSIIELAKNDTFMGDVEKLSWCNSSNFPLLSYYSIIQDKYWNVSLFGYWQIQKIPCFLLALPAFLIIIYGIKITFNDIQRKDKIMQYLVDGGGMIPYTLHATVLGIAASLYYNTEILTRMLFSSSPFPYLVLSRWMARNTGQAKWSDLFDPPYMPFISHYAFRGKVELLVFLYFMSYLILGSSCHIMGLPFT